MRVAFCKSLLGRVILVEIGMDKSDDGSDDGLGEV